MFDSRETVWISASIGVLIVILLALHFNAFSRMATYFAEDSDVRFVVADEGQTIEDAIVEALAASASLQGELNELVAIDMQDGEGVEAVEGSVVTVHYAGNTPEGIQFDNSYNRGVPFTFTLGQGKVIEGWEKGILGMKAGGKRALIVPARMAYGSRQVGPIPPNSALVFIVEVLEVR